MGRECCVLGCSTGIKMPFHTFPKDAIMANRWKKAIYSEKIKHLNDEQMKKCIVCYRHFADSDYEAIYRLRRLKPGVVPSLYLPNNSDNNNEADVSAAETETARMDRDGPGKRIETTEDKQPCLEALQVAGIAADQDLPQPGSSSSPGPTHLSDKNTKYLHRCTPKMWKLCRIAYALKKKQEAVANRQLPFRQRIRKAKQYSKSRAIEELSSSLTPAQQMFIQMQIKATKYAPKDRCFTLDERIAALSIMKQSSKCYQYLTQVFNLPSAYTLYPILEKINIHPGLISFINRRLEEEVRSMRQKDKLCFLMWDEMLLQPHLDYDATKKHIVGFEDFGEKRSARFADHALVFMLRGIQNGWKLPLAYYFCDGATKADQLAERIKAIAKIVIDSGLHLVAFICNNGKRNVATINKLKLDSAKLKLRRGERYYGNIIIRNQAIIPLYDPPHLIKSIRDNLLNNDLEYDCAEGEERKFASWQIIEQAYHMDLTHSVYRLMPKITIEHIVKSKVKKRRVKNAAQVLSMSMCSFIHHHTKLEGRVSTIYGPLKMPEKKGRDTAEILFFFDQLFDSVNGHTLKPEKPLRVAVSDNSPHFPFWERAIKRLHRMRFVNPKDKKTLKDLIVLKNWISTIKGFRRLWKVLKTHEFKYFKPRILNQDALTHFFGQIRSLGRRNINPTCTEFESSFKTLLLNNLTSRCNMGNNSENKVDGMLLFTLREFICDKIRCTNDDNPTDELQMLDLETETKSSDAMHDYVNICNSIVTSILNNSRIKGCDACKNLLVDSAKCELVPNECLLKVFKDADDILTPRMSSICYLHHTALMLETELYTLIDPSNLSWLNCREHEIILKELLISNVVVFYITKWCAGINKILTGEEHD